MAPLDPRTVVVTVSDAPGYPDAAPFHPAEPFPEAPFAETGSAPNPVYAAVRDTFARAGLDSDRFGRPDWNPLGELVRPGETVLLKPNLVKESHPTDPEGWRYVLTHGSVVRAVADYLWLALERRGTIVIADAPQTDSSFEAIVQVLGMDAIQGFYASHGLTLELVDLRLEEWENRGGVIVGRRPLPGDPRGGVAFDLGDASELADHRGAGRYYGAFYDEEQVNAHHSGGRHEYLLAGSAIAADVVFSLPKLKTHKKAGVTATLKNLVGVNGDKNWLPHHTSGTPESGGDEFPSRSARRRVERAAARAFRRLALKLPRVGSWLMRQARPVGLSMFGDTEAVVRSGNWWGNDTVWRMCLDLNKLVFYGNPDGTLRPPAPESRKRHVSLVDGIVAGEGSGPLNPSPVAANVLVFGTHPASVDAAATWLMGFDPERVPIVRQAFRCRELPLAEWGWQDVSLVSNKPAWDGRRLPDVTETFSFRPHFGWVGRVERE